jgi:hypothetical protein
MVGKRAVRLMDNVFDSGPTAIPPYETLATIVFRLENHNYKD